MKRRPLLALMALASAPALGCGHCVEDKIAAAYDHTLVAQTTARGHEVAFIAFEARVSAGKDGEVAMRRALEGIAGVDRGSVRVAAESGALSVAFDPRQLPPGKLLAAVERKLSPLGLSTTLLRFGNPASTPAVVAGAPAAPSR